MIEKQLVVGPKMAEGNIALLVQTAGQYKSELHLQLDNKTINLKSIMGVISIGNLSGSEVTISAEGKDDAEAIAGVYEFLCQ
jgi:phosphotransferase system HPr (HPr) family protein